MGKLEKRGWFDKSEMITSAEAVAFRHRCRESHTARWRARSIRYEHGAPHIIEDWLPVTGGRLIMDSSDSTRAHLTLEVGAADNLVPRTADDPLVPFGQMIQLFVSIDYDDGSFSKWLKMFEGPIMTSVFERPSMITTLECADASAVVDQYLHRAKTSYGNRSLRRAIYQMVSATLPEQVYDVEASPSSGTTRIRHFTAEAGQGRWEAATKLASSKGHEAFFDWNGDLVIRRDITDDDDDLWPPQAVGPDIGTVRGPIAHIRDGGGGTLLGVTASTTREGSANAVQINVSGLVRNRRRHRDPKTHKWIGPPRVEGHWSVFVPQKTGPAAWGDKFGYAPLVLDRNVHAITPEVKSDYTHHARNLLHRRRGLVRYLDVDCLPLYWLTPDDKVRITFDRASEAHFLQRVEWDLKGGPSRLRTRQLSVTDPGDLGGDEI